MVVESATLTRFTEGVWTDTAPVSIVGTRLTASMTVLRLSDGGLLLYSPLAMTPERRAAVESLGNVTHLYAPNLFHHLHIGEWSKAFPSAKLHAPRGLSKKRLDLRIDRAHDVETEPTFAGIIDEVIVRGFRLEETALVYRPTRTALVADLVHNVGRPEGAWTKFYTRRMGFYDRVALSKALRWTAFSDRRAARGSLDELLGLSFDSLIVGHGTPIEDGAKDALEGAYGWLGK